MSMHRPALIFLIAITFLQSAHGQTTQSADATFDFGSDWIHEPAPDRINKTSPRTVQLLGQALANEPTAERRAELASDLGTCELPSAAPFLVRALSDPDESVRASAARSAGKIGAREMLAPLRSAMADPSSTVRREVVYAGAALGDPSLVTQALSDADETVFAAGCKCASTSQHGDAIAVRLQHAEGSATPTLVARIAAIEALGRLNQGTHAGDVLPFLHASFAEQVAALDALSQMKATGSVDQAAGLLGSANPTVRRAAVAAMTNLAVADRRSSTGQQMLADPDVTVRQAAADLLGSAPAASAIPLLVKQLDDPYEAGHAAAIRALIAAKADDAAVALLDHSNPRRREDGSYILGQLKSDKGFDRHVKLLGDSDWDVIDQAARSLLAIGRPEVGAAMVQVTTRIPTLVSDVPAEQIPYASFACGDAMVAAIKFGELSAFDNGRQLIGDPKAPDYVRCASIWAFGVIGKQDKAICQTFYKIMNDPMESAQAQFESVKALGNLRYKPAVGPLEAYLKSGGDQWMIHAALDRINGETTPYVVAPNLWKARVSITDLSDNQ
jgi:HEAT repeat protein